MKNIAKIGLVCAVLFSACGTEKKPETKEPEQIKGLNHYITNDLSHFKYSDYIKRQADKFLATWQIKGMTVAVVKNERLVYTQGFGLGDAEAMKPVNPGDLFRVASVSKLVTAVGIMQLEKEGKLHLESKVFGPQGIIKDTILNHVKDPRLYTITVRNLLAHAGGWSVRYGDAAFISLDIARIVGDSAPATMQTYYKFISSRKLHFTPGTQSSYSNMGYMFLGEVIAWASGEPYEKYIQEHVLIPNRIYDMHIGASMLSGRRINEVKYYDQAESGLVPHYNGSGEMVPKPYGGNPIELLGPAGGWIASSLELSKLVTLIDGHNIVGDIFTNRQIAQMTIDEDERGPLGWKTIYKNGDWWRTGSMAGTSAAVRRQANGISWVVICNSSCWKGAFFTLEINRFMQEIQKKVKEWPNQDLFTYRPQPNDTVAAKK